jgi:hypothetical protein
MAAVLACGPGAVLSHRSAAALWGLLPDRRRRADVTSRNRRGRGARGIDVHGYGSLRASDVTAVRGIPCTTVAQSLLGLAAAARMRELRKGVSEAEVLGVLDLAEIDDAIAHGRGRPGVASLRAAVSELHPLTKLTRGDLERRFLDLCERAGLPRPEVNSALRLRGRTVAPDFLWRDSKLIVETDGRQFHNTASAFERDRRRDQLLSVAGWTVIRCTWRQVVNERVQLARTLRSLLR